MAAALGGLLFAREKWVLAPLGLKLFSLFVSFSLLGGVRLIPTFASSDEAAQEQLAAV